MASQPSPTLPTDIDGALEQGWSCLRRREWPQARDAFQQVVAAEAVSASAWEGLAIAALCLDDAIRSRSANERAYREYLERGDFCGAARVAIRLAVYHDAYRGESAIANGWFARARSLLDTVPAAAEHAWLAFWKAHLDIHVHGEVAKGEPSLEDAIRLVAAGQHRRRPGADDTRPSRAVGDQRGLRGRRAPPSGRGDDRGAGRRAPGSADGRLDLLLRAGRVRERPRLRSRLAVDRARGGGGALVRHRSSVRRLP